MSIPFIESNDQTEARREHLEELQRLVGNVYPNKFERSEVVEAGREDTISAVASKFRAFEPQAPDGGRPPAEAIELANQQLNSVTVRVAGRIASPPRVMGKAAFVHLSDGIDRLQVYIKQGEVFGVHNSDPTHDVNGWTLFRALDHGDFIGVEGFLFITRTGELSIHIKKLQFLAKALLPMPDKLHGIQDPELRQRQRYADLIAGSLKLDRSDEELTSRQVFERRSKIISHFRRELEDAGYAEVETPMLTPLATGAAARPFKTHHHALDIDLYARIAPELYLKRLLVGGFEKVYELNRNFRNEGISTRHNPEFTMLEFYWAYADVGKMMDFCEKLLTSVVEKVAGVVSLKVPLSHWGFAGPILDFTPPWRRLTMKEAILQSGMWQRYAEYGGPIIEETSLEDARRLNRLVRFQTQLNQARGDAPVINPQMIKAAWDMVVAMDELPPTLAASPNKATVGEDIQFLFEAVGEGDLHHPTFITDFPKDVSPLAKASPQDRSIAERFELYIGGMEVANGFSELNDPNEQYNRFKEQVDRRERGDEEAMVMDEDYIRALSYGMPPAAGVGIGIDRLVMLLSKQQSIRDVILFPHMRPERKPGESDEKEETSVANSGP